MSNLFWNPDVFSNYAYCSKKLFLIRGGIISSLWIINLPVSINLFNKKIPHRRKQNLVLDWWSQRLITIDLNICC